VEEETDMRKLEVGDVVGILREIDLAKYNTPINNKENGEWILIRFDVEKQRMLGCKGKVVGCDWGGKLSVVQVGDKIEIWWAEDLELCNKWRRKVGVLDSVN